MGGVAIGRRVGIPDTLFEIAGIALALSICGRDSAAWLGIAMLLVTPSVHGYTFLFLLAGLLTIRRDVAIPIAALFLGVYHAEEWWLAAALVAGLLVAMTRWPGLRTGGRQVRHEGEGGLVSPA